MTDSGNF